MDYKSRFNLESTKEYDMLVAEREDGFHYVSISNEDETETFGIASFLDKDEAIRFANKVSTQINGRYIKISYYDDIPYQGLSDEELHQVCQIEYDTAISGE